MKTFSSKQFDGSTNLLIYFEKRSSKGNDFRKHENFGLSNFEKEKSQILIILRRNVYRLVKDPCYFIVYLQHWYKVFDNNYGNNYDTKHHSEKRQHITREVAPADTFSLPMKDKELCQ